MKKLTKKDIESIALNTLMNLRAKDLHEYVRVYYNDKVSYFDKENEIVTEEGVNPKDYFEYAATNHIISMSFEGPLYDYINYFKYQFPISLERYFEKYGLYYEFGNAWNLTFYPIEDDMEIEYTVYEVEEEPEPIRIWPVDEEVPIVLRAILLLWHEYIHSSTYSSGCILGAGMYFEYEGVKYVINPAHGSWFCGEWEPSVDKIKDALVKIGATNVYFDWGVLD